MELLNDLFLVHIAHKLGDVVLGGARGRLSSSSSLSLLRQSHGEGGLLERTHLIISLSGQLDEIRIQRETRLRHGLRDGKGPRADCAIR